MQSLEEVFAKGEPTQATPAPEPQAPAAEASYADDAASQATGDTGTPPGAAQTPSAEHMAPVSALREERSKRQELERRLAEIEQRYNAFQYAQQPAISQQQPKELTPEEIYADVPGAFKQLQQQYKSELRQYAYASSEASARTVLPDYDQVIQHYQSVARQNPYLARIVDESPSPAFQAYQIAKQYLEQSRMNDPQERAKLIEAEVQKRMQEERAKFQAQATAESVPTSLAAARGSGAPAPKSTWSGPPKLEDIFKRPKRR